MEKKFTKFLLIVIVTCMVLFCVGASLGPFVNTKAWYYSPVHYLPGVAITSVFFLILLILLDKKNKVVVKTPRLPEKVFIWGTLLAGMGFCTMKQTPPMSQMSQALMLFTIACLTCMVLLAPLLWLTTEHEEPTPADKKPGLRRVK